MEESWFEMAFAALECPSSVSVRVILHLEAELLMFKIESCTDCNLM